MSSPRRPRLVLAGAGGHAKVLADLIAVCGRFALAGAVDSAPRGAAARACGQRMLGTDADLPALLAGGIRYAAVGLGASPDTSGRARLRRVLAGLGFRLPVLVHPAAVVSCSARLEEGAQVMAGAVVNAGARVGAGAVLNTGAVIEHDCDLGADSFVAPGAVLGGAVVLGEGAFVGLGACVNPGVRIGSRAIVGAGAAVIGDVPRGATVVGVPARARTRRRW